jgi:cyanophycin synthetase
VPANGQKVLLRFIESTKWGEDRGDATSQTHPDNIDLAERAARVLGLTNAGIDIISKDISIPWYQNKAVINEVNYAPHFGATDVARSIMPHYVDQLMHGDGRIPIEIFIGEHLAWEAALKCQQVWIQSGLLAWITSDEQTLNHHGSKVILASSLSFQRTLALLSDKQVEAIAIVIRDDQWLNSGAPVNKIDAWHNYMDKQSSLKIKELTHFLSNLMSP